MTIIHSLGDNSCRAPVVHDYLARLLDTFAVPLAQKLPSPLVIVWPLGSRYFKHRRGLLTDIPKEDTRGVLELICIMAIEHTAMLSESLGITHDCLPLLEGIRSNIMPYGEYSDVSLSRSSATRILLQNYKIGSPSDYSAQIRKALGPYAPASLMPTPELSEEQYTKNPGEFSMSRPSLTLVDALGLERQQFPSIMSASEIENAEKALLQYLEQQLDTADLFRIKCITYERLSTLAYKRQDFNLALEHLDRALAQLNGVASIPVEGLEQVKNFHHLLCRLTEPSPDLPKRRCFIFEKLSVAAFERKDFDLAIEYSNWAIAICNGIEGEEGRQGHRKLLNYRDRLCGLKKAAGG